MMIATGVRRQWLGVGVLALAACSPPAPAEAPPAAAPEAVVIETASADPPAPAPSAEPALADRLGDALDGHEAELEAARERAEARDREEQAQRGERLERELGAMEMAVLGRLSTRGGPGLSAVGAGSGAGASGGLGHGGGGVAGIGGGGMRGAVVGSGLKIVRRRSVSAPLISGPIDPVVARHRVDAQIRRIERCFQSPAPWTRSVQMTFNVDASGAVTNAVIAGPAPAEMACARAALAAVAFPSAPGISRVSTSFTVSVQ